MVRIYNSNIRIMSLILNELGYETSISAKVIFDGVKSRKINYYLEMDKSYEMIEKVEYGQVKNSGSFEKKIIEYAEKRDLISTKFRLPQNILDKICPSVFFEASHELQEKLIPLYFEKLNKNISQNDYNFLKGFPEISIYKFAKNIGEFYEKFNEEFNQAGLSLITLNDRIRNLMYNHSNSAYEKVGEFKFSHDFNGAVMGSKPLENYAEIVDDMLFDFFNVISKKLETGVFTEAWKTDSSEKIKQVLTLLSKQIYKAYKKEQDFIDIFDKVSNSFLMDGESKEMLGKLQLNSIEVDDFFVKNNEPYIEYITIEKRKFLQSIPLPLVSFFKDEASLSKLLKSSIEGSSNVSLKEMVFNYMSRDENTLVIVLASEVPIDKVEMQKIILDTVGLAIQYPSVIDIRDSLEQIAISVFQKSILRDVNKEVNHKIVERAKKY